MKTTIEMLNCSETNFKYNFLEEAKQKVLKFWHLVISFAKWLILVV